MPIDIAIPSGKASTRKLSGEQVFFTALAATMFLAVLIGFGRTYYLRAFMPPPEFIKPATPLVHLHGLLFTAWIVLFMTQTSLVTAGRRDLHMKLGLVGLPVVCAMIGVGTLSALHQVKRFSFPMDPLSWMAVPILAVVGFGTLFLTALALRRTPGAHKRLMLLGMAAMIGAAFARIPGMPMLLGAFFLPNIYAVALIIWDLIQTRRPYLSSVLGGLLVLFVTVGPMFIWRSPAWLAIAKWLASFV